MDENLVGYLLKALDPETHGRVAAHLAVSPEARERLEVLRRALEPLAADRDPIEPPPGLRFNTLARIAEHACRKPEGPPRAPVIRSVGGWANWWRRADVLVAACLLITALGVGLPWIVSANHAAVRVACQDNLQKFYAPLVRYAEGHGKRLPDVGEAASPHKVAGLLVPTLRDAGLLTPNALNASCPVSGEPPLAQCYAYSLGHLLNGKPVGPSLDPTRPGANLPLMADGPPPDATGNSLNHRGAGQNVLFTDGRVTFCATPTVGVGGDHIYLNRANQVARGVSWDDAVLGR